MIFGSVCSGIEAASVAWEPLGWKAAFLSEIDPFASAVLAHRYPGVPNLGDFTKIDTGTVPNVDLLVGGTPCQSFSVAGLRKGLDDERGNLALEYCRLAFALGPTWVVWENVPGVLSSASGRDFACFLSGLSGLDIAPPNSGWRNSGFIASARGGYGLAWRVLDAQHFGVPQRRRRVFVVGYFGDWRPAAAVLLEPESVSGHPAPRREAGQETADGVAHGLAARSQPSHREDSDTYVAHPLKARGNNGSPERGDLNIVTAGTLKAYSGRNHIEATYLPVAYQCQGSNVGPMGTLRAGNGNESGGVPFTVHTLRTEGFDASEDGTGRGVPLISISFNWQSGGDCRLDPMVDRVGSLHRSQTPAIVFDEMQITSPGNRSSARPGMPSPTLNQAGQMSVAFSCKDHGADVGELAPTLRAMGHSGSHANAGGQIAVAHDLRNETMVVRRLTPRECERLQGFPDDWTAIPWRRGKKATTSYEAILNARGQRLREPTTVDCPDGPRYRALGNSMATVVVQWIGRRIDAVNEILRKLAQSPM